jgi:acetyl/propionyl-CoA carboxylase alpha subunit/acetyl-CoA carboxylase carboxyltransferase component
VTHGFSRLAIVNRGEAAMRLIHAVREWNSETGDALRTIALFTEPDRHGLFVREADEAVDLGSAYVVDPRDGRRKSSYLDPVRLEAALRQARADAVWVGWGFVAEHADFAALCERLGIVFIGPPAAVMRRVGDKITSKRMAEEAKLPVAPWSGGAVESVEEARTAAARLGYPLMVKATAGGGGRGIRTVRSEAELAPAFESARDEAAKAFGDGTLFLERLVGGARHVEVQILGDQHGTVWGLGVRDCTVQRRNQKVLEESPSPALTAEEDRELRESAARLGRLAGYSSAGTVEFLFDPLERRFSFMEVNARLQVEHPVTELTTGLDLVKLQIHVARGGRLEGEPPSARGHAIEVRLNAEDAENGFAPAPGAIELFRLPTGPGLRVDTGVREGDTVPVEFDSMIAKLIAFGHSREEALSRLVRGLAQSAIVIRGGLTNRSFLLELLSRPELRRSEIDIGWLDRLAASGEHVSRRHADVALLQAAIGAYDAEQEIDLARFLSSAARGRPLVRKETGHAVELRHHGRSYRFGVQRISPQEYRIRSGAERMTVRVESLTKHERSLQAGSERHQIVYSVHGTSVSVEVDGVAHRISRDEGGMVRSPAPAIVLSVAVQPGDTVAVGQRLLVLEAMKTEMPVVAPFAGRVRQVVVAPGAQVDAGAPLALLAPVEDPASQLVAGEAVAFSGVAGEPAPLAETTRTDALFGRMRHLLLGFDGDPDDARRLADAWRSATGTLASPERARALAYEEACLRLFTDLESLFVRRPDVLEADAPASERSAEGHLYAYLRSIEGGGRGLPAGFVEALGRALRHYGVEQLERSPALEQALLRICRAHDRMAEHVPLLLAILERRLEPRAPLAAESGETLRETLDRLIGVTHGSEPALCDLARQLRHRAFDRPVFEAARSRVYEAAEGDLEQLARDPAAKDRAERLGALVECPQPLVGLVAERFESAGPEQRALLLELLLRRYYRLRSLRDIRPGTSGGRVHVRAIYDHEGSRIQLLETHARWDEMRSALESLLPEVAALPRDEDVAIDLYVWRPGAGGDPDATHAELLALVSSIDLPRPLRRLCFAVAGPGRGRGMGGIQHFTYRPRDGVYVEDRFYRGIHPMMAKRLHLWRLSNFETERLPSAEDLYVVRAVARANPKDERLFAVGEVRDLTPVCDASGRVVHLPDLDRMLLEAFAGIRSYQSRLVARRRLQWNRVFLYVWPPLALGRQPLVDAVHRLAPAMEDLGLEKIVLAVRVPEGPDGALRALRIEFDDPGTSGMAVSLREPATEPLEPVSEYVQKVVAMRQRGLVYPFELVRMLTRAGTPGEASPGAFAEYDLDAEGELVPVTRPPGQNGANVIVGVIRNVTPRHPEGMARVILLGDPSRDMGAFAEPECRRILAALALARRMGVPVDWLPVSSGARIAMDTGTETLDWTAQVLRELITFTQDGGEVNVVVTGINVGGQSYWNAEATMLMHTSGILVMTPEASMLLTGKRALDYSGSVSAEDHLGIGGFDRIMGPNGQAQYRAKDAADACRILVRHHELTYVAPGERFPRPVATTDPRDRDVRDAPHGGAAAESFAAVGEIFRDDTNPGRRRSFEIRRVMAAAVDRDHPPLERWSALFGGENAVVWDARLGGHAVSVIGIESHTLPRPGFVPADGPDQWTAGTLFPISSKKVARAINAASGRRPVVLLANLVGFDGSPESLRELQLEYGAEIGRAVVNFRGPLVFCVISRYHGGAYVVFSKRLNERLEVAALEGAHASVIGGAPAAAVVFSAEVEARTRADARVQALDREIAATAETAQARLRARRSEVYKDVRAEKLGEIAEEFDRIHSVARALAVGSLDRILPAATLRPYLIDAVERGMAAEESRR